MTERLSKDTRIDRQAHGTVIEIRGASQNNLKNLNLDIEPGTMTVITGPSGSGKSSLAFDTLYAEGQRRYVETFSPYARQFLERCDRPKVERIDGVPPAIAINQNNTVRTSRSTVGTMTELNDYLKLVSPRRAPFLRRLRHARQRDVGFRHVCRRAGVGGRLGRPAHFGVLYASSCPQSSIWNSPVRV